MSASAKKPRTRVAILISGRGSNMATLIHAARNKDYPAEIALVVSNRPDAKGVEIARASGIETAVVDHKTFAGRDAFERELDVVLENHKIEFICLAGFMRVLTPAFVGRWQGRMLNIHPSLLPSFKGHKAHEEAIAAGVKVSGCTVHFVAPEADSGKIVAQAAVPVLPGDTADDLAARVLRAEHKIYPLALWLVLTGQTLGGEDDEIVVSA